MGDRMRICGPESSVSPVLEESLKPKTKASSSKRKDKRKASEPRKIFLKAGVISKARGSAYIETGNTKLMVAVYGPRETQRSAAYSSRGLLQCDFKYAPFSCSKRRSNQSDPEEVAMTAALTEALQPALRLEAYPKSVIEVFALVLENDGSALSAAITCASVAVANAGIEMFDLVASCSLAFSPKRAFLDPTQEEQDRLEGHMTLSYMGTLREVTGMLQQGEISATKGAENIEAAIDVCSTIHEVQQHALLATIAADQED